MDHVKKINDFLWELPVNRKAGMKVPARIYASEKLMRGMESSVFAQISNVAGLPGIIDYAYCLPDGHSGYGFPIGGTAAFDPDSGIISPGGIGFDINCGMRLLRTSLTEEEVRPRLTELIDALFRKIPTGVGGGGLLQTSPDDFRELIQEGADWCLKRGRATATDLERTEEGGRMRGARAEAVSQKAIERGHRQTGSLGSGNHYLEVQTVRPEDIHSGELAHAFGLTIPHQVVVMVHCGSRGFGHQVAQDYLMKFLSVMTPRYGLRVNDRQLACAPFSSEEGRAYFEAMQCAVNMAFVNRQLIIHAVREVFCDVFGRSETDLGLEQIYDVTHNTAKLEKHMVHGEERTVLIHRKGATRAFAPGMAGLPSAYAAAGQPVIIGGSMETGSYLLAGTAGGAQTFYTTAHGSGRVMGRNQAKKKYNGRELARRMAERGIIVRCASYSGLAEEAGGAYKDIDEVVRAADKAGLSRRVARLTPLGTIKG